jgi:hypothetical protein
MLESYNYSSLHILTPRQPTIWLLIRLTVGIPPQRNTAILYITAGRRGGVASSERGHSKHLRSSHKLRGMNDPNYYFLQYKHTPQQPLALPVQNA